MASMTEPETAKPPVQALPIEPLKYLSVAHPIRERAILVFGCRTKRGTLMGMSRLLVHQAATIVAQTEGFLSRSKDRESRIPETDALIASGKCYFHANDLDLADYTICADFDAWEPPAGPDELPEPWKTLTNSYNDNDIPFVPFAASSVGHWIKAQDQVCILTGNCDLVECQHVVPQQHATWAEVHGIMERATGAQYTLPGTIFRVIDDIRCLVTMDPFAHRLMNTGMFCPFPLTAADGTVAFVAYYMSHMRTASGVKNHLRSLNIPARISPYILYVRFAWSIFKAVPHTTKGVLRKPLPAWATTKKRKRDQSDSGMGDEEKISGVGISGVGTGTVGIGGLGIGGASGGPVHEEDAPSMISDNSMSVGDIEARERNLPPDLLQIFADVEAGKIQPPAILYEYGDAYPGMSRIAHLREEYLKENPQVIATGDPSTPRLSRAGSIP
ncbi:hypothetical protein CPB85DRAFT_1302566 [Mucidula mucida]|nr:hypothetical protein CPB85DRAFT_1302566 [Mucidula mucida]